MNMHVTMMPALLSAILLAAGPAQAALSWSSQLPETAVTPKAEQSGGGHAHGGHRGGKPFYLNEAAGAEAEIWFPTLVRRPLHADDGLVRVSPTGVLNYHLLYAKKRGEGVEEVALRYYYLNGKPTDESPRLLVNYRKAALDIVPSPLTREHQRYLSGKPFRFTLLFRNRPLAGQPLTLTTSNGTSLDLTSDDKGRVTVELPDDFAEVQPGRRANQPAEFLLALSHVDEGTVYRTTLSADYYVNPAHWRSGAGGLLAMLAGFVGGLVVIRRSNRQAGEVKNA